VDYININSTSAPLMRPPHHHRHHNSLAAEACKH